MSSDIKSLIKQLKQGTLPLESDIKHLCQKVKEILLKEPNVLQLSSPITICGDIHGQFNDFLELFSIGGSCPTTNYIFLGDFVDRGYNSIETFLLLLALKVQYPDRMNLLRGNHESRQITRVYGFFDECKRKYPSSMNVWLYCTEIFDCLSLAAVIDNEVFCVHGGLSPCFNKINELNMINRFQDIPIVGTMTDVLWSDPDSMVKSFGQNPRGAGFLFGEDVVEKFNYVNGIRLIARAHQLMKDGYGFFGKGMLVTVWSAPNYCNRCGNLGAILELGPDCEQVYKKFEAAIVTEMNENMINNKRKIPEYFL